MKPVERIIVNFILKPHDSIETAHKAPSEILVKKLRKIISNANGITDYQNIKHYTQIRASKHVLKINSDKFTLYILLIKPYNKHLYSLHI